LQRAPHAGLCRADRDRERFGDAFVGQVAGDAQQEHLLFGFVELRDGSLCACDRLALLERV
jgi:hypothetical protein